MATLDHPSFIQPPDPGVSLWRYMDLSKFVALLQKRALVFARADNLGDPFEGSVPVPTASALQAALAIRKILPEHDLYAGMTDEDIAEKYLQFSDMRRQMVKASYVNCWHMNEAESAAMWKLYSKSSDALCIRTSYEKLAGCLPEECYIGIVSYIDFKSTPISIDNTFNPFLFKRRSFAHEREARAIIVDFEVLKTGNAPPIREVNVDLGKLVEGLYVSPDAPEWFREVVGGLAAQYGLGVPVEHSEMNVAPLF